MRNLRVSTWLVVLLMGAVAHVLPSAELAVSREARTFEFKMISSGANRPGLPLWKPPYRDLLVALHGGLPLDRLPSDPALEGADGSTAFDRLLDEGLAANVAGVAIPQCMVIPLDEGQALAALADGVAAEAIVFLRAAVDSLRERYREVDGFAHLDFDDVSFFLASDVLLDNWQIRAVERGWLRAERPLRGSSRYYAALMERAGDDREAFGIYGNQVQGIGDGRHLGVYGNRRGGENDLTRLDTPILATLAALPDSTSRDILLAHLFDALRGWIDDPEGNPPSRLARQMADMGLARDGRPLFAVLDSEDQQTLSAFASLVTDSLIDCLERARPTLRSYWDASAWGREVPFEEFGIWWYHFFYTALTDRMAEEGTIRVPSTSLFHYALAP